MGQRRGFCVTKHDFWSFWVKNGVLRVLLKMGPKGSHFWSFSRGVLPRCTLMGF